MLFRLSFIVTKSFVRIFRVLGWNSRQAEQFLRRSPLKNRHRRTNRYLFSIKNIKNHLSLANDEDSECKAFRSIRSRIENGGFFLPSKISTLFLDDLGVRRLTS